MVKRSSQVLFKLKTHTFLSWVKFKFSRRHFKNSMDSEIALGQYFLGYTPNLNEPSSLNEKLVWLKFNYTNDLWRKCADKVLVKEFLEEIGLARFVVKTLGGPYKRTSEIDLNCLPDKFVLKTNHDSGTIFVCDKRKTNFKDVFEKLDYSASAKYSQRENNGEWVYDQIDPVIFAEELLEPSQGDDLCDYKFFCFNGVPKFLYVISNRNNDERLNLKTLDYSDIPCLHAMLKNKNLPRNPPPGFEEMKQAASIIAPHFGFVRVDFFSTKQGPKIGELTFFPTSGHGIFYPRKFDYEFGSYLDLSFAKNYR